MPCKAVMRLETITIYLSLVYRLATHIKTLPKIAFTLFRTCTYPYVTLLLSYFLWVCSLCPVISIRCKKVTPVWNEAVFLFFFLCLWRLNPPQPSSKVGLGQITGFCWVMVIAIRITSKHCQWNTLDPRNRWPENGSAPMEDVLNILVNKLQSERGSQYLP